jgi:nicotinamidase-related amidase
MLTQAHAKASQLLVIDVQERLARAMQPQVSKQQVHNAGILVQAAALLDIPVTITEQYPKGLGATLGEVREKLPTQLLPLEKTSFSCCNASGFESSLVSADTRPEIYLTGMETHICVLQTAAGLQHWGYQVTVIEDAVCSRHPWHHQNGIERMRQNGINISNTESLVFEWLGDSSHAAFRQLSPLFRDN